MLKKIAFAAMALSGAFIGAAHAGEQLVPEIPRQYESLKLDTRTSAAALAVPPDVQLISMYRLIWPQERDRITSHELPTGGNVKRWKVEGIMGYASFVPFAGSHAVYSCFVLGTKTDKAEHFSSTDPNCEGQGKNTYQYILGWVANTQLEGTTPLYRCDYPAWDDHFDSVDPTCEGWDKVGAINNYVLGYIWY
ncbi:MULTISPECIES: hypothetical protein [Xanthomonas]|uniref:hypothetical protein n=1 Tax=Xanthomonas TaxID=338 RepID=UPI00128FE2AB|nr:MULTISPECIES: hypothetical protein [Xanthomonas]MEA9565421.1 hypothetical protein [Xanthomonas sp. WHRI 8932A]